MRKLLVASHKGGVGKTTTCVNLAAAVAKSGSRVLLLDADPLSAIGVSLNLAEHPNRQSLRQAGIHLPGVLVMGVVPGVDLISPYEEGACSDLELGDLLRLLNTPGFADCYSCLIVDTPPFMGGNPVVLLNLCEEFVVVMRAEPLAYRTLPAFLELVQRSKQPDRQIQMQGILLTLPEGEPLGGRWECELRGRFGTRVLPQVVPFDDEVGKALEVGQIVSHFNPQSLAVQQYQALAEHLSLTREAALVGLLSESPLAALTNSYQAELSSLSSHATLDQGEPLVSSAVVDVHSVHAAESKKDSRPCRSVSEDTLHGDRFLPVPTKPNLASFGAADIDLSADPDSNVRVKLEESHLQLEPELPVPEPARTAPPKRRLRLRLSGARPNLTPQPKAAKPVSPSALLTLQKKTRGLLSSPYAKLLWIGVAMAGGIALRSAKLPEFMLPIIVGIIVAASVVLVLRLTGAGDQAFAPNQPDSRPQPRPSGSVPQPAACKDPTSRLDQFADRASAQRRKKSL